MIWIQLSDAISYSKPMRKATTRRARSLRRQSNTAEQLAWKCLRQLRRHGFPVRRQHPIPPYFVDFAIVSAKLVIEIDGGVHDRPDIQLRDQRRSADLTAKGWRILRFTAEQAGDADALYVQVARDLGLDP